MEKKRILIISRSFYPENSPRSLRTTELVKEFARQEHEVTLLTVRNDEYHNAFEEEFGVTIKDIGQLKLPNINLNGSSGAKRLFKRGIRRGLLQLFEYPDIELMYRIPKVLKNEANYDLLISIAVPHPIHWGVAWAWRKVDPIAETWIADCGDPYYGLENDSFKKLFYFAWIEKWFCQKVDYITIPFEGGRSAYFNEFQEKIRVIPQGLSFPDRHNTNHTENGVITFAYFGNIDSYRHYAVPFLKKLNSIEKEFKFIVYTRNKNLFKGCLDQQTLDKCEIHDYVDRDTLLNSLAGIDFLVHFPYQEGTQKSLKLVDYNFLQKPILEYRNDEISDNSLREFLEYNFEQKKAFEDYRKYKIENICNRFLELIKEDRQSSIRLNNMKLIQ
ncbi:glycosyltransferase [Fodinibius salsisoli]|uniref:Glycosyltransferase n=1 Tax=Fodinibius salsisoli TaxID=2820877 RepID=A0ABT3PLD5_9BACT|nr:glycosyltransferase [Fodinibius salsisoli]MCW9706760.1 glycosyltransferase [Fodinibius salsisoli]